MEAKCLTILHTFLQGDKLLPRFIFYFAPMSITEAIEELIHSEEFKSISKQRNSIGGAYRSYVSRYKKGLLKTGAMVELLVTNGYEVTAKKVVKKKR